MAGINILNKFDKKMMELAREVAETSQFKHFHLGCVITYKKHIVSVGTNSDKTHPMQKAYNAHRSFTKGPGAIKHSLHAEMNALLSITYPVAQQIDWKYVKMYVYRICNGKRHLRGNARPCAACMAAIKDMGIRHLYYTTDTGIAYERLN